MSKRPPIIRRTDNNQSEIVNDLRDLGCRVVDIHVIGSGVPDLIATFCGFAVLVEVKNMGGKTDTGRTGIPRNVARAVCRGPMR